MQQNRTRVLPHAIEAETSILGGVLIRNEVLAQLETLEVEHFYDHRHRVVFQAMRNLEAVARPLDVVTVENEIARLGKLEAIGDVAFLGQLALKVPTVDNVLEYAAIVEDKARIRGLMLLAGDVVERGYASDLNAEQYFDDMLRDLSRLDRARPDETLAMNEMLRRRIAELEALAAARGRGEQALVGMPTGIAELDRKLGGYPLGDLTVLCARPAMGKTSMAMAAVDATTAAGFDAHVFSSEGGWRMYADRVLSRGSGVPVERVRAGDLSGQSDAGAIARAMYRFRERDNWAIDPRADLTPREIVRSVRARKAKRKKPVLVVVDYLQILARTQGLTENEALDESITTFSKSAVNDDLAYLVLSQLNRKVEERTDKRPQLSDLRGSGAIEERARVVVSPYRGSVYFKEPKPDVDYDCECEGKGCSCGPSIETFEKTVQVLLLKNNNGQTGRVFASWRAETTEMA